MKEDMQKVFFPKKKLYAFRGSSIHKFQLKWKLSNSALNSSNKKFNTPSKLKNRNPLYFFLNLTKMLLYFNKSGSASKKKTFQVHIHPIRFSFTLNTFLCLGVNILPVRCKQIIELL